MASTPVLLLLLIFFCIARCFASDTISFNSSISGNQTIVSEGGNFELGFFPLGNKSSHNHYVGIWYKKVSPFTPVWIANRGASVSDPGSSQLRISADGNLVLINQANAQIWSTDITTTSTISSSTTVAVLLDSGNLVLREKDGFLWQSMDHPTDTWLPGGRLGRNKVTGEEQMLTCWRNSDDPAPGMFSLGMDTNGSSSSQYSVYWNRSVPYWSSGEWNGNIFTSIPEMTSHYMFNFQYVSNANATYFTYSLQDHNVISRLVMDLSGQIKQLIWIAEANEWIPLWTQPTLLCDVYAVCGAFGSCDEKNGLFCSCLTGFHEASPRNWNLGDHSQGCRRNTPLEYGSLNNSANCEADVFSLLPGMTLPKNPSFLQASGAEDCRLACLRSCNCTAYSYSNTCSLWYGDLLNLQQQADELGEENNLYLRLAASEQRPSKNVKRAITWAFVGSAACIVALSAFVFMLVWVFRRRQNMRFVRASQGTLVPFKYSDLKRVTKNFSEKLGGGSFGSVYRGTLPDSAAVAVKKLEGILRVGDKQFRTEVRTIGTIHHVNLVRLRGFCSKDSERLLVYDYMPNGSLDRLLFKKSPTLLNWHRRYRIALGAARGLLYLHEGCRDCIIHCDIKPENILLDELFVAKVADFGLAKLVGRDFSRVLTTVRGTIGYLAPEWISGVPITAKADVYSYGMVLLEMISGRRNAEHSQGEQGGFFPLVAARKVSNGEVISLLDERLKGNVDLEELNRACKVACWCIQDNEIHRPSMEQVVQILEGVITVTVPPIPKSLQTFAENAGSMPYFSEQSSGAKELPAFSPPTGEHN